MTKTKPTRGRPFRTGESGNPKGRPKGSRNRPVELTVEREAERFIQRGTELALMGETDAAIRAFEKALAMSWGAQGGSTEPGEAREKARELVPPSGRADSFGAGRICFAC